jgi:hypothetical protein
MKKSRYSTILLIVIASIVPDFGLIQSSSASGLTYFVVMDRNSTISSNSLRSGLNQICDFGKLKSTKSLGGVLPSSYSGNVGDSWTISKSSGDDNYFWDGKKWLAYADDSKTWMEYSDAFNSQLNIKESTTTGFICTTGTLTETDVSSGLPPQQYKGIVGDSWIIQNGPTYYWNGEQWLTDPGQLARRRATASPVGEVCTYGKNRDTSTSTLQKPPANYRGTKGDLWVVLDPVTRNTSANFLWNGHAWIQASPKGEALTLENLNQIAQSKARSSRTGEVCRSGEYVGIQSSFSNPPAKYHGAAGDTYNVYDASGGTKTSAAFEWDGNVWRGFNAGTSITESLNVIPYVLGKTIKGQAEWKNMVMKGWRVGVDIQPGNYYTTGECEFFKNNAWGFKNYQGQLAQVQLAIGDYIDAGTCTLTMGVPPMQATPTPGLHIVGQDLKPGQYVIDGASDGFCWVWQGSAAGLYRGDVFNGFGSKLVSGTLSDVYVGHSFTVTDEHPGVAIFQSPGGHCYGIKYIGP